MNSEMVAGYRDGLNRGSPEPGQNRSASYRHGFAVARFDLSGRPAFGSAGEARKLAAEAERRDAEQKP